MFQLHFEEGSAFCSGSIIFIRSSGSKARVDQAYTGFTQSESASCKLIQQIQLSLKFQAVLHAAWSSQETIWYLPTKFACGCLWLSLIRLWEIWARRKPVGGRCSGCSFTVSWVLLLNALSVRQVAKAEGVLLFQVRLQAALE